MIIILGKKIPSSITFLTSVKVTLFSLTFRDSRLNQIYVDIPNINPNPKSSLKDCIFDNIALHFECLINKTRTPSGPKF